MEYFHFESIQLVHDGGRYHIEPSPLICGANQWTGFYKTTASVMKELTRMRKVPTNNNKCIVIGIEIGKKNFQYLLKVYMRYVYSWKLSVDQSKKKIIIKSWAKNKFLTCIRSYFVTFRIWKFHLSWEIYLGGWLYYKIYHFPRGVNLPKIWLISKIVSGFP